MCVSPLLRAAPLAFTSLVSVTWFSHSQTDLFCNYKEGETSQKPRFSQKQLSFCCSNYIIYILGLWIMEMGLPALMYLNILIICCCLTEKKCCIFFGYKLNTTLHLLCHFKWVILMTFGGKNKNKIYLNESSSAVGLPLLAWVVCLYLGAALHTTAKASALRRNCAYHWV